jgi:microsomal epoxide hydrolase
MALPFSIVPAGAKIRPSPFKVAISDEQIKELHTLIKISKPPPETYESSQKDRRYGVTSEWMATAKDKWLELDWYFTRPLNYLSVPCCRPIADIVT